AAAISAPMPPIDSEPAVIVSAKPTEATQPMPAPTPPTPVAAKEPSRPSRATAQPKIEIPADLEGAMEVARKAEAGPDKGVAAWKEVVAKNPSQQAPRRELARVLRKNEAWSQLADALRDEEAKAASSPAAKAAVLRELAEVYGRLNNE